MEQETAAVPIITYTLTRFDEEEIAARDERNRIAETPNEWFARKFPEPTTTYGPAILEGRYTLETPISVTTHIIPTELNHDFFAAILGGDGRLGHHVIYYLPELQFYFLDARFGYCVPTSEAKLMTLLSQYLIKCAAEMPKGVEIGRLFIYLRREANLKQIVKKARSLLAAGPDFFFGSSGHKRIVGMEVIDPAAVPAYELFVKEALLPGDCPLLTVPQAFEYFTRYCQLRNLLPIERNVFKGLISDIIREEYGMALRRDLKNEAGKFTQGWKGLVCRPLEDRQFAQLT